MAALQPLLDLLDLAILQQRRPVHRSAVNEGFVDNECAVVGQRCMGLIASTAGTQRGRTRTGMGCRIAPHSWRALERQKSSNRNCDFLATPWLLPFGCGVTWVIIGPPVVPRRSAGSPEGHGSHAWELPRGDRWKGRRGRKRACIRLGGCGAQAAVTWSAACTPRVAGLAVHSRRPVYRSLAWASGSVVGRVSRESRGQWRISRNN